jgi:hypothetical protein
MGTAFQSVVAVGRRPPSRYLAALHSVSESTLGVFADFGPLLTLTRKRSSGLGVRDGIAASLERNRLGVAEPYPNVGPGESADMRQVVDELSEVIEAFYRARDPRADAQLIASLNPMVGAHDEVPCQLPRDIVEMMEEIISSEGVEQPTREQQHGTNVWARRWLRELYVSRE